MRSVAGRRTDSTDLAKETGKDNAMSREATRSIGKSQERQSGAASAPGAGVRRVLRPGYRRTPVIPLFAVALAVTAGLCCVPMARAQQASPSAATASAQDAPIVADFQIRDFTPSAKSPPSARRSMPALTNPEEGLRPEEVVPVTGLEYPVDLSSVLQLAETQNPTIALGREAIQEALALQLQARGMLLPSLNAGTMYHLHQGVLQQANGQILKVEEQSIYFGGGDWTVGSQTVAVPAVQIFAHVGDAYFAPLVAAQVVASRSASSRAIENANLLDITSRYLALVGAEGELYAIRKSEEALMQVVRATSSFAQTGQGRVGDANRARSQALLLHSQELFAQENLAVAAAELSRTLDLDPSVRLRTAAGMIEVVQLVDPSYRVEELIPMALGARPEAAAAVADISAADYRLKAEYARPWLPVISVGFSAGGFGGGGSQGGDGSLFQNAGGRTDFDVFAFWTLQNMGLGNAALQKQQRSARDDAVARRGLVTNRIGREVADAFVLSERRRQELDFVLRRLKTAADGAREEIARTRGGEGLPLEAINSVNLLTDARQELVRAIVAYDLAQFQLFVAIGQTPGAALPDPKRPGAMTDDGRQ
jgi:outer membrane protein TolC